MQFFAVFTIIIAIFGAGCSSKSSSSASGSSLVSVTGMASAGPISSGLVRVYSVGNTGSVGELITSTLTDSDGRYTLSFEFARGRDAALLFTVTGGTYTEEATGITYNLQSTEFQAVIEPRGGARKVSITPATHIAAKRALAQAQAGIEPATAAVQANRLLATAAGMPADWDITEILPANPHRGLPEQGIASKSPEAKHALLLAGISQFGADRGSVDSLTVANALGDDLSNDGLFDGVGTSGAVYVGGKPVTPSTWGGELSSAQLKYTLGSNNNNVFSSSDILPLLPTPTISRYKTVVYAANYSSPSITVAAVNPDTLALSQVEEETTANSWPAQLIADPAGRFLFAPQMNNCAVAGGINVFRIDQSTGALTLAQTASGGVCASGVATHPSGRFVYLTAIGPGWPAAGQINAYAVDPSSGALTAVQTIVPNGSAWFSTVDPTGRFLYFTNNGDWIAPGTIEIYSINQTTGALTHVESFTATVGPNHLIFHPNGKYAYLTSTANNPGSLSVYSVNATTGRLTHLETVTEQNGPWTAIFNASASMLYVPNYITSAISVWSVNPATGLVSLVRRKAQVGGGASLAIDPISGEMYVANYNNNAAGNIARFSLNGDDLTQQETLAAGNGPTWVTTVKLPR